jgi:hypothetical protein
MAELTGLSEHGLQWRADRPRPEHSRPRRGDREVRWLGERFGVRVTSDLAPSAFAGPARGGARWTPGTRFERRRHVQAIVATTRRLRGWLFHVEHQGAAISVQERLHRALWRGKCVYSEGPPTSTSVPHNSEHDRRDHPHPGWLAFRGHGHRTGGAARRGPLGAGGPRRWARTAMTAPSPGMPEEPATATRNWPAESGCR